MSRRTVALLPEEIMNARAGGASSRDVAVLQSLGTTPTNMMLASRPRTHDLFSEPFRAMFEIGHEDGEEPQYLFTSSPSAATTSNTIVDITPLAMRNHLATQGQEEVVPCEITQNGVKFKGSVRGVRITATQVVSKTGQYTPESHQPRDEERNHRPQGQEKKDLGFINQSGAQFFQTVTDTDAEVSQYVTRGQKFSQVELSQENIPPETSLPPKFI